MQWNPTAALLPRSDGTQFCPWTPHPFPRITPTPTALKPHPPFQKNINRTTISPIIRGHRTQRLTHLLGGQSRNVWLIVRQLPGSYSMIFFLNYIHIPWNRTNHGVRKIYGLVCCIISKKNRRPTIFFLKLLFFNNGHTYSI